MVGNHGKARKSWGAVISDSELGGGRSEGVRKFLQDGGPVRVDVWGGDVGPHPKDVAGPEQFSKWGHKEYHREAAAAATDGWELGIPAYGRGTEGIVVQWDKEVGHKEAEQDRAIYCDVTNFGPL